MREYETTLIIQPEISDEGVATLQARLDDVLGKGDAIRLLYDDLGKRRLAYEIQNFQKGRYVMIQFLDEGQIIPDLERALRLEDSILRFLTVQVSDQIEDVEARRARATEEERIRAEKAAERAKREAEEAAERAKREAEEAAERAAAQAAAAEAAAAEAAAAEGAAAEGASAEGADGTSETKAEESGESAETAESQESAEEPAVQSEGGEEAAGGDDAESKEGSS